MPVISLERSAPALILGTRATGDVPNETGPSTSATGLLQLGKCGHGSHRGGPSVDAGPAAGGLAVVHHVLDEDAQWLVAIQLRFEEGYVGIEVDPDHDEVELSFAESAPSALRYWEAVVRRDAADAYADSWDCPRPGGGR